VGPRQGPQWLARCGAETGRPRHVGTVASPGRPRSRSFLAAVTQRRALNARVCCVERKCLLRWTRDGLQHESAWGRVYSVEREGLLRWTQGSLALNARVCSGHVDGCDWQWPRNGRAACILTVNFTHGHHRHMQYTYIRVRIEVGGSFL